MYMKCCLSCSDESCDFVVTFLYLENMTTLLTYHLLSHFLLPVGEKNMTTSHNIEVADAKGILPHRSVN